MPRCRSAEETRHALQLGILPPAEVPRSALWSGLLDPAEVARCGVFCGLVYLVMPSLLEHAKVPRSAPRPGLSNHAKEFYAVRFTRSCRGAAVDGSLWLMADVGGSIYLPLAIELRPAEVNGPI
ncbi:hypothetical protein NE237_028979 [Protea cynaroides]|uniref:Uncharacterized protein n=1 Tax=Protea cynaroides TaxID=273540 RepID=A0A9Q0GQD3_9MAGN|nr:hypothetical protein NE237_028979 [Protea cynaroides]